MVNKSKIAGWVIGGVVATVGASLYTSEKKNLGPFNETQVTKTLEQGIHEGTVSLSNIGFPTEGIDDTLGMVCTYAEGAHLLPGYLGLGLGAAITFGNNCYNLINKKNTDYDVSRFVAHTVAESIPLGIGWLAGLGVGSLLGTRRRRTPTPQPARTS